MTINEVIKDLDLRFTSGNENPVKSASINAEQWDIIKKRLTHLEDRLCAEVNTGNCQFFTKAKS